MTEAAHAHTHTDARALYARARNLLLAPSDEWARIAAERPSAQELFVGWVLPLSAFFFIAPQVGAIAFPVHIDGRPVAPSLMRALGTIIVGSALMAGGVWLLAWVIDACARAFDGRRDRAQALKLAAYSGTGLWLAGVFGLAPPLALLGATGLVSFYTLYRGLPVLMHAPRDKALPYAASVVAAGAVIGVVLMTLASCAALLGGPAVRASAPAATAAAAPVAPVAAPDPADKLRRLLPEAAPGGWVRTGVSRNHGGAMGFTGLTVEAAYENGDKRIVLRVIDAGAGAADAVAALRLAAPERADGRRVTRHVSGPDGYAFLDADEDAGVVREIAVVGSRLVVAAEGRGGATAADLRATLDLVDMVRVAQIARGA